MMRTMIMLKLRRTVMNEGVMTNKMMTMCEMMSKEMMMKMMMSMMRMNKEMKSKMKTIKLMVMIMTKRNKILFKNEKMFKNRFFFVFTIKIIDKLKSVNIINNN